MQHDDSNRNRYQVALQLLLSAEKETNSLIEDVREAIVNHHAEGIALKAKTAESQGQLPEANHIRDRNDDGMDVDDHEPRKDKGKGKEYERDITPVSESADSEDSDIPQNPAGEEHSIKRRALQQRLRECQITLHKVYFLKGDVRTYLYLKRYTLRQDG